MAKKQIDKLAMEAGRCLRKAVREEFKKKALLGQYVIINHNGKPHRVLAEEALKMAKGR